MRSTTSRPYNRTFTVKHVINDRIRGDEFRLINAAGEQLGIVSRAEALKYAEDNETDLVLIAAQAQPPVVKAIDYHKFLYQEEKKNKDSRKGQKKSGTKDIQLSLFIGEQDFQRLNRKSQEFLEDGYQVRIKLKLFGRQLGKTDMAMELIKRFISQLTDASVAVEPKVQGKFILAVVVRKK